MGRSRQTGRLKSAKLSWRMSRFEKTIIVTRKTELEELTDRFNTPTQARFYLEQAGQKFEPFESRHKLYHEVLASIRANIPRGMKHQIIERDYLPQFLFDDDDLVVTIGIDGLVVNTAKYLTVQPILAVNPDPDSIEGVLLPFDRYSFKSTLEKVLRSEAKTQTVTMAEATLNDGQHILAFNDLFIGRSSHISAKYEIQHGDKHEQHSSSGVIVSTGAGSTGWLRSVYTGAVGIVSALGGHVIPPPNGGGFDWDENYLIYSVREPFPSKSSQASLVYGVITPETPLTLSSNMAETGVIFSDGIERDYVDFNAGSIATISIADRRATLFV